MPDGSLNLRSFEAIDPDRVPYYVGLAALISSMRECIVSGKTHYALIPVALVLIQLRLLALYGNAKKLMFIFGLLDLALAAVLILLLVVSEYRYMVVQMSY